jgi:hypothetical protein
VKVRLSDSGQAAVLQPEAGTPMTEQRDDREESGTPPAGPETGSAPQPLDFPGADQEPPGRPDGDQDPEEPTD